jgi:uroporphyrinogen-III decarboxylase
MSHHLDTVIKVLRHQRANWIPRGELFISRDFLDLFFDRNQWGYVDQLETAAQSLGLSLVGVDLNPEWSRPLLWNHRYKKIEPFFSVGCLNGPVAALIGQYGFVEGLLKLKTDPPLFADLGEVLLKETETIAKAARNNGFSALAITDDIAGNRGLFFSWDIFSNQVWPVYSRLAGIIKAHGLFAFFHCDGDITGIIEDLIEAGYDCLHPVDAQSGLNIYQLMRTFHKRVAFMGHIDLMAWGEKRIKEEIISAQESFKEGGLILGSTGGLCKEVLPSRVQVLYNRWKPQ